MTLEIIRLGTTDYGKALDIQENLLQRRQNGQVPDTLVLVEHPPVITLGRRAKRENIYITEEMMEKEGVDIYEVSRGGDVTYHGPGQIVGYPIIDLKEHDRDVRRFVWNLQEVFIRLLEDKFRISAHREEGTYTGVWVGSTKITAIGIAIKKWVTMHGFAFNVSTNLEHFRWINPCGLSDRGVTSLEKLLGRKPDYEQVTELVAGFFSTVYRYDNVREVQYHGKEA